MNKKILAIIIFLMAIIGIIIHSLISSLAIRDYLSKDMKVEFPDKFIDYQILRCNFGINNIEYAFVGEYKDRIDNLKVFFYNMKRNSLFTVSTWSDEYIGGTTIKNTTFPELVKMVKEDCSQFQQSKGDFNDKKINWSYSEYVPEPPEPQLTEDEIAIQKELEEIKRQKSIENRKDYKPIEFKIINE